MQNSKPLDAIVVGAGIAGLYAVYRLRQMGLDFQAFDAASDVGGTWWWNCYPGARVDSQSYVYQYWFSDELLEEWDWSERFPAQGETEKYLSFVADKFDLRKHYEFDTRIAHASWDEATALWTVETEAGERYTARYFVSCAGMLSTPKVPPFEGHEKYQGVIAHTARWPREGIDLKGKRVGVVGTGATGIQVIQTIAGEVGHMTVFQRTAQYAVRMNNERYTHETFQKWRDQYPELKDKVHHTFAGFAFDFYLPAWSEHTPEQRRAEMEKLWADGSLAIWVGGYQESLVDPAINEEVSEFVREKIRAQVKDPVKREILTPRAYGFGTYRVPLENGYYEAFNRDNVDLVDVRKTPIERFTEKGLVVDGKEYEFDVVILATGFDAGTGALARMDVRGRDGRSLTELWNQDIRSTLGLQVHGFPNLFTVAGPLAPSTAFCNMTTCLQQQVDWVADCIDWLRVHDKHVIEPTAEKENWWVSHHDEVANATLLVKTESWYTGANIEGKPRRLLSYIGGVGNYRDICDQVKESGYEGFAVA
ncbi:MAG: NAD(P)/FAD-dependent oxidoreductase [Gammaproteobacteria bacterium]|nr:NAD(P)/FAD-dependent oxidoreductase [Gammaproteobacteria bacterium]